MDKIKKRTHPTGHGIVDELKKMLCDYNEAFIRNDMRHVIELQGKNVKLLRQLTPHFESLFLSISNNFVANKLENLMERLKTERGAGVEDIQDLLKLSAAIMKDEL